MHSIDARVYYAVTLQRNEMTITDEWDPTGWHNRFLLTMAAGLQILFASDTIS